MQRRYTISQQQDQIFKSHNNPDGVLCSLNHSWYWKKQQLFKAGHEASWLPFYKREGFLIHRGKCARQLSPINFDDLCMCVWMLVCGQWYLGVFSFCSVRSDCWCCDCCVKWLSSVQSDSHTNVFPLFPLQGPLRYSIQVEGVLVSYTDQPRFITEGGARAKAKHQHFFYIKRWWLSTTRRRDHLDKFILWLLSTEWPPGTVVPGQCYCETGGEGRAVIVCSMCIQIAESILVEVIFLVHRK